MQKYLRERAASQQLEQALEQSDAYINSAERGLDRPEVKWVDERMPGCPDVEDKWEEIAKAYIPDGIREFQDFPSAFHKSRSLESPIIRIL